MHSVSSVTIRSQVKCLTQPELQTYRVFHGTLQALEQAAKQETTAQVTKIKSACRYCDVLVVFQNRQCQAQMPAEGITRHSSVQTH